MHVNDTAQAAPDNERFSTGSTSARRTLRSQPGGRCKTRCKADVPTNPAGAVSFTVPGVTAPNVSLMPREQAVTVLVFTGARISELLDADIDDLPASPRNDVGLTVVSPYAGSGPGVEPRAPGEAGQDRRWRASGCMDPPRTPVALGLSGLES